MRRKNGFRRRRFSKRRLYRSRGSKYTRRVVRRTIRSMAETKYYYRPLNEITIDSAAITFPQYICEGLTEGLDNATRVGSQVQVAYLKFKAQVFWKPQEGITPSCTVRFLVLYPKEGIPMSTVVNYMSQSSISTWTIIDPSRIKVLYDRTWQMNSGNASYGSGNAPNFKQIMWMSKIKYKLNYTETGSVDREPLLFILADNIYNSEGLILYYNGYTMMAFKDL